MISSHIVCRVCHGEFKELNHKHLARHDLTPAEYKKEFNLKTVKSPETRLKITVRNKKNWQLPQYRRHMTAKISAARIADREKYSRLRKELWKDPPYRKNMLALNKSPKRRRAVSQQMKKRWKDPKARIKVLGKIRAIWADPRTKAEMLKKRFSNPDIKKNISLARKKVFQDPKKKASWYKARWGTRKA